MSGLMLSFVSILFLNLFGHFKHQYQAGSETSLILTYFASFFFLWPAFHTYFFSDLGA